GQQPQLVPLNARVFAQFEEMPAYQQRLVAVARGLLKVGAVALQSTLSQLSTSVALGEMSGIGVVLQHWVDLAVRTALQPQARFLEVVVAADDGAGAGLQAHAQTLDHRFGG